VALSHYLGHLLINSLYNRTRREISYTNTKKDSIVTVLATTLSLRCLLRGAVNGTVSGMFVSKVANSMAIGLLHDIG